MTPGRRGWEDFGVDAPSPTPAGGMPELRSWTLALPFTAPLSANHLRGLHWGAARRLINPWRDSAIVLARKARIPRLERFTVVLHFAPRKAGQGVRDLDNCSAMLKPLVDGLIKAKVSVDDNAHHYTPTAPVIHPPTGEPGRLWLVVVDLTGPATH